MRLPILTGLTLVSLVGLIACEPPANLVLSEYSADVILGLA